jgi:hypothetical protein
MERDYLELGIFMNSLEMYDKQHQAQSLKEFRQFVLDMFDNKGPKYMVEVFRLYLKTYPNEWNVTAAG